MAGDVNNFMEDQMLEGGQYPVVTWIFDAAYVFLQHLYQPTVVTEKSQLWAMEEITSWAELGHTRNLLFPLNQSFLFQFQSYI